MRSLIAHECPRWDLGNALVRSEIITMPLESGHLQASTFSNQRRREHLVSEPTSGLALPDRSSVRCQQIRR